MLITYFDEVKYQEGRPPYYWLGRLCRQWLMKLITPRVIQPDELAVLEAAISRASVGSASSVTSQNLQAFPLSVFANAGVEACTSLPIGRGDTRIADGLGRTASGKRVDVMVWTSGNHVSALDIADHESSGELPVAESVTSLSSG
jgi:hypothetical protein